MNAAERLDQIGARANAATKGTWTRMGTGDECYIIVQESGDELAPFNDYTENHDLTDADADFIAHAHVDVPALVAALRAALELHAPDEPYCSDDHHNPYRCPCATVGCRECERDYPCPTVTAIEEALR